MRNSESRIPPSVANLGLVDTLILGYGRDGFRAWQDHPFEYEMVPPGLCGGVFFRPVQVQEGNQDITIHLPERSDVYVIIAMPGYDAGLLDTIGMKPDWERVISVHSSFFRVL